MRVRITLESGARRTGRETPFPSFFYSTVVVRPFSKREVLRSILSRRTGCYAPAGKLVSLDLNKSLKGSSDFGATVA